MDLASFYSVAIKAVDLALVSFNDSHNQSHKHTYDKPYIYIYIQLIK